MNARAPCQAPYQPVRHRPAHFGAIRPATTMVQVAALIDPRMKVEIEADALVPDGR